MIPLEIEKIAEFLKQEQVDAKLQGLTNQLCIVFKREGREFPLFIKASEKDKILQLILFLPCTIQSGQAAEVGRLLHLLNKEIDLPGFGMDEAAKVIFYRVVLPLPEGEISAHLLKSLLISLPELGHTFLPTISSTASGMKFETMVDNVKSTLNKFTR